jgi:hypothetical protein
MFILLLYSSYEMAIGRLGRVVGYSLLCSASMEADFFLTSIAEDFSRVCYSFGSCFLGPSAHFIFILVEPVATKNMTLLKGYRGDLHQLAAGRETIDVFRPPRYGMD